MDFIKVNSGLVPFGGTRIVGGQSSVNLWSDAVVLASAWSMEQPEIAGDIFTFRGTVTKGHPATSQRNRWFLRDVDGGFIDDFDTRIAAVEAARRIAIMRAFRGLNEAQRAS